MLHIQFTILRTPVSQQANSKAKQQWRQEVQTAARPVWGTQQPVGGVLAVAITFLFDRVGASGNEPDVDNVPKPILDALKGLVYPDDRIIMDLLCRKRYLHGNLQLPNISPGLLQALRQNVEFVHIAVEDAPI